MRDRKIWHIPVSIILTVLAIILLVAGSTPVVLQRAVSENTLNKVLEPFDLSNIGDSFGRSYATVITQKLNNELMKLAREVATQQGYTGDISVYSDFLTEEDIEECLNTKDLKELITSKAAEYFKALRNKKKDASLDVEELIDSSCIRKLQARINSKLATIDGSLGSALTDEQLAGILENVLTSYGIKALFDEDSLDVTRDGIKNLSGELFKAKFDGWREKLVGWLAKGIAIRFLRNNIWSVVMIVFGCLCIVLIFAMRFKELARAGMYAIVILTVSSGLFCIVGNLFPLLPKLLPTWLSRLPIDIDFSIVTDFFGWCLSLVRNIFLGQAGWFLLGTVPFWALEVWYYVDKKMVEHATANIRRRADYEDEAGY